MAKRKRKNYFAVLSNCKTSAFVKCKKNTGFYRLAKIKRFTAWATTQRSFVFCTCGAPLALNLWASKENLLFFNKDEELWSFCILFENCFVAAICHQLIYLDGTGPNWSRFRCVYTLSVSSVPCHCAAVEGSTVSPLIHVNQAQDWPDFVMSNAKQHCIDNFCQDTLSDRNLSPPSLQCWERWTNLSGICEGALVFALIF